MKYPKTRINIGQVIYSKIIGHIELQAKRELTIDECRGVYYATDDIVKFVANNYRRRVKAVVLAVIVMAGACGVAMAAPAPEVLCVIGEAENQGYSGMLAVSEAIRNRGTLKGVYGCKALRVVGKEYTKDTFNQAQRAWEDSAGIGDITHGATHWENIKAFGTPYWVKSMVHTVTINDHAFYREKTK
jgi:hypothetical protein